MEIATDIMAIIGWGSFGGLLPGMLYVFRSHQGDEQGDAVVATSALTFALIAASFVLGN